MDCDRTPVSSDQSRRTVLKKGILASSALALGLGSVDPATAQGEGAEENKALMFNDEVRAGAEFRVVSPVLEQTPDVEGVQEGNFFSDYNTRIIEYTNTNEEAFFFPTDQAEVSEGSVYRLHEQFSLFGDDAADQNVVSVTFEQVPADDVVFVNDDGQLDYDEDFDVVEGGGKVLLRASNFFGGALVRIESGVVDWTPRETVEDSDIFSDYRTRFAEYLNTGDHFQIYPAAEADIAEGATYVVRDEFDITPPGGNLVTAELERVDEDDLVDLGVSDDEIETDETSLTDGNITES